MYSANEEKIRKISQEIMILKTLNIKLNYFELSRKYKIDRGTMKKYNSKDYKIEKRVKNRKSRLDDLKDEIIEKLRLLGITISK